MSKIKKPVKLRASGVKTQVFLNGLLGHFAAFKDHIGFYPTPSGMLEFKHELSRYKHGEVSGQFPVKEPLPIDLIGKIMRFWVKEYKKKGER